jgi:hypothetical protein
MGTDHRYPKRGDGIGADDCTLCERHRQAAQVQCPDVRSSAADAPLVTVEDRSKDCRLTFFREATSLERQLGNATLDDFSEKPSSTAQRTNLV